MKHRERYLHEKGWKPYILDKILSKTTGAHSLWISPHSGKIYIRSFAVQIQRNRDKEEMKK